MPEHIPQKTHHKASWQAVVRIGGRDIYLGSWGTKEANREYDRLIAEWLASGRRLPDRCLGDITIVELIAAYLRYCRGHFQDENSKELPHVNRIGRALKSLRMLYGKTDAKDFGPLALKAVRGHMLAEGSFCRRPPYRLSSATRMSQPWSSAV